MLMVVLCCSRHDAGHPEVHFIRCGIVESLVDATAIVEAEVPRQATAGLGAGNVAMQVNFFVLHAPPFCGAPQNGAA